MKSKTWVITPDGDTYRIGSKLRKKVMIESPFAGDTSTNLSYLKAAIRDAYQSHQESPMAFHILYTQMLCDDSREERTLGIDTSFVWHKESEKKCIYIDMGISSGMALGIKDAIEKGIPIEFRSILENSDMSSWVSVLNSSSQIEVDIGQFRDSFISMVDKKSAGKFAFFSSVAGVKQAQIEAHIKKSPASQVDNYARHAVRDSIIRNNTAPIALFLVEDAVGLPRGSISESWSINADHIEVYIDAGFTREMEASCRELVDNGSEILFRTTANHEKENERDRYRVVDEINKTPSSKDRLELVIDMIGVSKEIVNDYPTDRSAKEVIERVNKKSYSSREREFVF